MNLSDFHASTGDWREQLRRNERKTRLVIMLFIIIYVLVGLLVDVVVIHSEHQQASLAQLFFALITFQIIPIATLILAGIAVISLMITYTMYDRIMLLGTEYHQITEQTASNLQEKQLYNVVEEMKVAAGLRYMPKVFIINADYMNAFASGYSEKSAMVAITRGLMEKLERAEMQAVMAHELSHIRHHDVKLTLMVTVLSNILLLVIDMLFYSMVYKSDKKGDNRLFLIIMVLRYTLPLITVILTLFLSRTREYMADSGAVELMRDNEPMARALIKINEDNVINAEQYRNDYANTPHEQVRQASYLYDSSDIDPVKSFNSFMSTHPNISSRLRALGFKKKNQTPD